jgi:hypothetical protein
MGSVKPHSTDVKGAQTTGASAAAVAGVVDATGGGGVAAVDGVGEG